MRAPSIAVVSLWLSLLIAPRAQANLLPAAVDKAIAPATRALRKTTMRLSVETRASLNRVEAGLRPDHAGVADAIARTRRIGRPLSPLRLAGFAADQVKHNPSLVPTYAALTLSLGAARLYGVATLPPALGGVVYALTAVPQALTALFAAEHATRTVAAEKGQRPRLRDTLVTLAGEYRAYNQKTDRRLSRVIRAREKD